MTMKEFDQMRKDVTDKTNDLSKAVDGMGHTFELLKAAKIPEETMGPVRAELNSAIMATNSAIAVLRRYELLLDGIAGRTEISWPPVCGNAKKS